MEIIARERELTAAGAFLDAASERFCVLEVEGEPGIGKTTLWREILSRADARGFLVLSCRPAATETKLALAAVADLLEPVPQAALDALPPPQRQALEAALLRSAPGTGPPQERTLASAVRSLLAELSTHRPVLVAVDDAHWLDRSSATVLGFSIRRLMDRRTAWVLTHRLRETRRLDVGRLPPESVTRIRLGPVTLAALHHILQARLERPPTRRMLVGAHRASGGNPLFAIEVARELPADGTAADEVLPVPATLRDLLAKRLRRLPANTREALLRASALSAPTTSEVQESALAAAEEADIVHIDEEGRIRFRHPLFAAAVYKTASRQQRRRMHGRLARVAGDPEERARHLAAATADPDERVAQVLEQGAERARSRGAWDTAAELLERARSLTPADRQEEAGRRGVAATEHYVHAGDRPRARTLMEELLAGPLSRPLRADGLRLLGEISLHDENFPDALRHFEEALRYADDPRLVVTIGLGRAYGCAYLMDHRTANVYAHRALAVSEALGDRGLIAEALAYCAMYDYLTGQGADWEKVERSLALEDPTRVVPIYSRPSLMAAALVLYVGRHAEARERWAALGRKAVEEGDESDLAFVLIWLSWLETRTGNLAEAARLAEEGVSVATLTGSPSMRLWAVGQWAFARAHLGEAAETRRDCAEVAEASQRSGHALAWLWIAASLGLLENSVGNPDAAWRACEPVTEALEQQGIGEPVMPFFLPEALEALIALGNLDRAEALVDALEARGRELDRVWALATGARCRALLLAARGDLDGAAAAIDRAVAQHERIELPFDLGRALVVRGVIERRMRRRARAKASFEGALEVFERVGAPLWAERARSELARVGLRRSSGHELTEAERRVAEMTARGLTRREVAAALFISPKTVDATLGRVYRKLGIRSRAELGARMARFLQT